LSSAHAIAARSARTRSCRAFDDVAREIEYPRSWIRDASSRGFRRHADLFELRRRPVALQFRRRAIAYVYTRALNRGIAQVVIDGQERARSISTHPPLSGRRAPFSAIGRRPARHRDTRARHRNSRSSDHYVDLDSFVVE